MSHPSRSRASGPAQRRNRVARLEAIESLEERKLLAPFVTVLPQTLTYTATTTTATSSLGTVTLSNTLPSQTGATNALTAFPEAAAVTSVSELTSSASFGNDIVRITPGPGGQFGNDIYAISRGAGDNASLGAINRPGVIYRVDPATGKSSVFFDLNTVISQIDPASPTAANGLGAQTGLTNWYDITFDPEGVFDGKPSMFITSVDSTDPNKNAIYQVSPSGQFLGAFTSFTSVSTAKLTFNPTAILIPPVEQQQYLSGLIASTGAGAITQANGGPSGVPTTVTNGTTTTTVGNVPLANPSTAATSTQFAALYFSSSQFTPGTQVTSATALPNGVKQTGLTYGIETGLTSANTNYASLVYDSFADFGTPAVTTPTASPFAANPGLSGVQGIGGDLLINLGQNPNVVAATQANPTTNIDLYPVISTDFRRFDDVAFDQYGYFSQGLPATLGTGTGTGAGGGTGTGTGGGGTNSTTNGTNVSANGLSVLNGIGTGSTTGGGVGNGTTSNNYTYGTPVYAGSLFVADLASGLAVSVPAPTGAPNLTPVLVPIQGLGSQQVGVTVANGVETVVSPTGPSANTTFGDGTTNGGFGGRILRIDQFGRVSTFAQGFDTSNLYGSDSLNNSMLSIGFSADGTTLYAADNQGIWQFKTTASLAGSSSGSIIGLNDLRTLGVPYSGQGSAVDVIDTGVDATNTSFRGRVASGTSTTVPGGLGSQDTAATAGGGTTTNGGTNGGTGGTNGGTGGTNGGSLGATISLSPDGHGTDVAGIIAQFVPQATLNPINVFSPFTAPSTTTTTTNGGTGGTTGGGTNGTTTSGTFASNQAATTESIFAGFQYATANPFVSDPVRPGQQDRVIAASLAFGTTQTFATEQTAYKAYPQVVIAFKNQLDKFLKIGIAPIGAAGQFGAPAGASSNTTNGGTGTGTGGGTGTGTTTSLSGAQNNAQNTSVGDVNGMSLPAALNEVISVTGSYPFIYTASASTPPTDPVTSISGGNGVTGPLLVFANGGTPVGLGDAGTGTTTTNGGAGGTTGGGTNGTTTSGNLATLTAAETFGTTSGTGTGTGTGTGGGAAGGAVAGSFITYSDRILGSTNRSATTDFAAPALDAPTFRRTFNGDGADPLTFNQAGTSVSSAIVTGAYALVSSALDYWNSINQSPTTDSAYLTGSVGVNTLNYGVNGLANLTAYNNPNGINAILAYTAVPATDVNDNLSLAGPPTILGSTQYRSYARVSVSDAIAAIEGKVALTYLIQHGTFNIIDANHDNQITAQEIQNFVNNAAAMGLPEAGAMAQLLGGTARAGIGNVFTLYGEQPDQPDVLQRRFNFFDYAVHGKLQGSISIPQLKLLSKYILPSSTGYTITDRLRASANGFLIAPTAQRNFKSLQHLSPKYEFVPKSAYVKYKGTSPSQFGVNFNQKSSTSNGPVFTLFDGPNASSSSKSGVTGTTAGTLTQTNVPDAGTTSGTPAVTALPNSSVTGSPTTNVTSVATTTSTPVTTTTTTPVTTTTSTPVTTTTTTPVTTTTTTGTGSTTTPVTTSTSSTTSSLAAQIAALLTAPAPASSTPAPTTSTTTTTPAVASMTVTTPTTTTTTTTGKAVPKVTTKVTTKKA